jgi:hypothetical protein
MFCIFRPSFEVVREGRMFQFVSGDKRFEFADIVYDEKSFGVEKILTK